MTRKHKHLWGEMLSDDNLRWALHNACLSNGRSSPAKKKSIAYAREHPDELVSKLKEYLLDSNREYGTYSIYPVFDPKLRLIYATSFFPYRVAHHALVNVLEPIWTGFMQFQSYACRDGFGQHRAGQKCAEYVRRYKYCAQFDISQFYPSVDHEILKLILRRKIADKDVLNYCDGLIDGISTRDKNIEVVSKIHHPDSVKMLAKLNRYKEVCGDRKAGVPTGNYPSQWFGNVYMNESDEFLIRNGMSAFCRYCDDTICFSDDKAYLQDLKLKYVEFLWDKLKLLVSKAEVYPTKQNVDFCGFVYNPNGRVLLRKRTAKRQKQAFKEIHDGYHSGELDHEKTLNRLASMHGLLKNAQTYNFRQSLGFDSFYTEIKDGKVL